MIKAAKNPVGEWAVWRLARSALVKHFATVRARQDAPLDSAARSLSTIYYVNHSAWWDGHLCMVLARLVTHQPGYLMMEEKNLRRYRFFTWAGAYGVDRDDARAALMSLDYAAGLLREQPGCAMFVFPQGTIVPNDRRPLALSRGVAHLARRAGAVRLAPVALRYEFSQEQRPDAFISVGPARVLYGDEAPRPRALMADLAADLTATIDALRADVVAERLADFTIVLRGKSGIDRAFDQLASRGRRPSRRLDAEAAVVEQASLHVVPRTLVESEAD